MTINTKQVTQRRTLVFTDVHQIVEDAEQITSETFQTMGNWSAGQILMHLARSVDASIDGVDAKVAWPLRLLGRYVLKRRILDSPMSPGFKLSGKLSEKFIAGETTTEAGLKGLREAIARLGATDQRAPHVFFGPLTQDEWDRLHCRHAEMHLSFIAPHS